VTPAPAVRPAASAGAPVIDRHPRHARHARHLEVVAPPAPRWQLRTGPTFALGVFLAFAIAFAVVACQVVLLQGQQRLDEVDAGIATETDRYQQLRLEVAELEAPARIVAEAARLGMVPPPEVTYLTPTGAVTVTAAPVVAGTPDDAAPTDLDEHAATRPNLEGGG
jgi:hypothetical protein